MNRYGLVLREIDHKEAPEHVQPKSEKSRYYDTLIPNSTTVSDLLDLERWARERKYVGQEARTDLQRWDLQRWAREHEMEYKDHRAYFVNESKDRE